MPDTLRACIRRLTAKHGEDTSTWPPDALAAVAKLAVADPSSTAVAVPEYSPAAELDPRAIAALAAFDAGDPDAALQEAHRGTLHALFVLHQQISDPKWLAKQSARNLATVFGVLTDKACQFAAAAEAGSESDAFGPDDQDEGEAAGD